MLSSPSYTPTNLTQPANSLPRAASSAALPARAQRAFKATFTPSTNQTIRVTSGSSATAISADFSVRVRNMLPFKHSQNVRFEVINKIKRINDMVSLQAKQDAETFSNSLAHHESLLLPHITAASDGEINFYWKSGTNFIDLGFYGDGSYSFYAEINGQEEYGDNIKVETSLPEKILKAFSK